MRRKFCFKPTKRQQALAFNAQMAFLAAGSLNPRAATAPVGAVPKVRRRPQPTGKPVEADVVRAVAELLAVHPRVLIAIRQNSGAASYEAKSGKYQPIHFYRVLTGQPVTLPDFWGIMRDGRMLALEAKRPGWKAPRDDRERRQWAFLQIVANCGGIAGFVTSAEEANALLI